MSSTGTKLRELRAHYGKTLYRILYYQDAQGTFILLHAFAKKTPKIPKREIKIAQERMHTQDFEEGSRRFGCGPQDRSCSKGEAAKVKQDCLTS